jgi:intracellular sulfur oxidation DsrE/DsrF family protein
MENLNPNKLPKEVWLEKSGWLYQKASPINETNSPTVAIIDDNLDQCILNLLSKRGVPAILVKPKITNESVPNLYERTLIEKLTEILNKNHVELAIVDLSLGIIDRILQETISEAIMEELKEEGIKLIILSGAMVDPEGKIAQFADRILMKPIGVDKIIEAINEVMKNPKDRLD